MSVQWWFMVPEEDPPRLRDMPHNNNFQKLKQAITMGRTGADNYTQLLVHPETGEVHVRHAHAGKQWSVYPDLETAQVAVLLRR